MGSHSYKTDAIVIKTKKLAECDLIVTLLNENGERLEAVAHGARKPGSTFAGRMLIGNQLTITCHTGRTLDVVSECRVSSEHFRTFSYAQTLAVAPLAEVILRLAQPSLEQPDLYRLFTAFLDCLLQAEESLLTSLSAASLLKACSVAGFMPSFSECAICGNLVPRSCSSLAFSPLEGGYICDRCTRPADAILVEKELLQWCHIVLHTSFKGIIKLPNIQAVGSPLLDVAHIWARIHTGAQLKSISLLLECLS